MVFPGLDMKLRTYPLNLLLYLLLLYVRTYYTYLLMYLLLYVRTYCTYYCTRYTCCTRTYYTYCCPVRTTALPMYARIHIQGASLRGRHTPSATLAQEGKMV